MPKREFNITDAAQGTALAVRIIPGGESSSIVGIEGGAVTVQLAGPPPYEQIADALAQVLAGCLSVSQHDIEVLDGFDHHMKLVTVLNAHSAEVDRLLRQAVNANF